MRKRCILAEREVPRPSGGNTGGNVEGEDREEPEESSQKGAGTLLRKLRRTKQLISRDLHQRWERSNARGDVVPPRTRLPAVKLKGEGGTKLVSGRTAFAGGSRLNKTVGRQQVCARKGQPSGKPLGLVPILCLSKRACPSLYVLRLSAS